MPRSDAVRQQALERDGRRCQITGVGGPEWQGVVDVAHWKALGHGGSDELDVLENVLTLSSVIHRTYLHPGVSVPTVRIVHWDPSDLANGLQVEGREGAEDEWRPYPKMELWYYRRQLVDHVKENLGNMRSIQTLTGYHAMTIFELRLVWQDIDPTAASFDQLVSGMGWDPQAAHDLADKHLWLLDHKCAWPEGLTLNQLTEIIDREAPMTLFDEETESMQAFLIAAAEKSFSDLKGAMIAKGLRKANPFYYVVLPASVVVRKAFRIKRIESIGMVDHPETDTTVITAEEAIQIIQSRDEQGLKKAIRDGDICADINDPVVFRIGKAVMNITSVKNSLRLKDEGKTRIHVIQWPVTAADLLASVPEAYGGLPMITEDDSDQMFDDKTEGKASVKEDNDD